MPLPFGVGDPLHFSGHTSCQGAGLSMTPSSVPLGTLAEVGYVREASMLSLE